MTVKIAQIAVELEDGTFGVVVLQPERLEMLLSLIQSLSDDQVVKVLKVPGMVKGPLHDHT